MIKKGFVGNRGIVNRERFFLKSSLVSDISLLPLSITNEILTGKIIQNLT